MVFERKVSDAEVDGSDQPIQADHQEVEATGQNHRNPIRWFCFSLSKKLGWDGLILALLWMASVGIDRLWVELDQTTPAWDQARLLNITLFHWQHFQQFEWSRDWWLRLWQLSDQYPPLLFLATLPAFHLFGIGVDQALWINCGFTGLLLGAVYLLGAHLFRRTVGLLAAGICLLLPGLYRVRLDYLIEYPLVALVALSFCCLTYWWSLVQASPFYGQLGKPLKHRLGWQWLWAIALGVALGLVFLTKQSSPLYLLIPLGWVGGVILRRRQWQQLAQLSVALILGLAMVFPWVQPNWLLIFSIAHRSTVLSAAKEGDPALTSWRAWIYYLQILPGLVGWLLLLVPLVGLLLYWRQTVVGRQWATPLTKSLQGSTAPPDFSSKTREEKRQAFVASRRSLLWLLLYLVGGYLLNSLNPNKDLRYVTPLLPILAVVLAYGLSLIPRRWQTIHWATLGGATLVMVLNLFPILPPDGAIPVFQTPYTLHQAYTGKPIPHGDVIRTVAKHDPYLRSVIGVMTSTPEVNQHNVNFYGLVPRFQIRGREIARRSPLIEAEVRSLSWFLVQLDPNQQPRVQSPDRLPAKQQMLQVLEKSGNFQVQRQWSLPNGDTLKLFHRKLPLLEVRPLPSAPATAPLLRLTQVLVPEQVPPGRPVPITYRWQGDWQTLQNSLMLLSWVLEAPTPPDPEQPAPSNPLPQQRRWLNDHAIALGRLYQTEEATTVPLYDITERFQMVPPANLASGRYRLEVMRLDRSSGKTTTLPSPPVRLTIAPTAQAQKSPWPIDPLSQFRLQATTLSRGIQAYEALAPQIELLNKFDPGQDYQEQLRQSLEYRLQKEPKNRDYAYALALRHVIRRQIEPAIAALQKVVQLDSKNPNAHGYLAFVNLYAFHPKAAQPSIEQALKLNPNQPELYLLKGVASLMRGNITQAWQDWQTYQQKQEAVTSRQSPLNTPLDG